MTDVVTLEELLPDFGSAFRLPIEAVSFNMLPEDALTWRVRVSAAPFKEDHVSGAKDPTLQVTTFAGAEHEKLVVVHTNLRFTTEQLTLLPEPLTKDVMLGSGLVIFTPSAEFGPRFVAPIA